MKKDILPEPNPLPLGWIGGIRGRGSKSCQWWGKHKESIKKGGKGQQTLLWVGQTPGVYKKRWQGSAHTASGGENTGSL